MLRFGYQTIIFGHHIPDLRRLCEVLRSCGFTGVEFFQHPKTLNGLDIKQLVEFLATFNLTLLGLSGGRLQDRIEYLDGYTDPYLYLDSFPPLANGRLRSSCHHEARPPFTKAEFDSWLSQGYRFGIHPHVGKPIHRASDAEAILGHAEYSGNTTQVQLIVDTAHAFIVGDDPKTLIRRHKDRLASVHVKDWDASYGRASHRYAQGFRQLFRGDVPLEEAITAANRESARKDLWIVVEQDYAELQPMHSIADSARALAVRGWLPLPVELDTQNDHVPSESTTPDLGTRELHFRRELDKQLDRDVQDVYPHIAELLKRTIDSSVVDIYSYDESSGYKTLLASTRPANDSYPSSCEPALAEQLLRQDFTQTTTEDGSALIFPIFNSFNLNQIRFVVDIRLTQRTVQSNTVSLVKLLLRATGRFLDRHLNEVCQRDTARAARLAAISQDVDSISRLDAFILALRRHIKIELPCEECVFYLENPTRAQLAQVASDDALDSPPESDTPDYRTHKATDSTITTAVWQRGIAEWVSSDRRAQGLRPRMRLSTYTDQTGKEVSYILLAPILDASGRCIGVIKCGNRHIKTPHDSALVTNFTSDDLARIDALMQSAVPNLISLQQEQALQIRHRNVTHELKKPVLIIMACLDTIESQLRDRIERYNVPPLPYDWLGDAISWCELMQNLVTKPDFLLPSQSPPPELQRVSLLGDVIAPIVRWTSVLVRNRQLPQRRWNPDTGKEEFTIDQGDFSTIPRVWVNKNMFQQIFFNLLDNAIKYADRDNPTSFRIRIVARHEGRTFTIAVEDWGIGLEPAESEAIFREGVRGLSAERSGVTGTGFGLALVRRLVEIHGGTIRLTSPRAPTRFTITLPIALQQKSWPRQHAPSFTSEQ